MVAIYHFKLCRAILVGFSICRDGFVGMLEAGQEKTEVMSTLLLLHVGLGHQLLDVDVDGDVIYRDDLT